ncbi:MAG: hypothetical protein JNK26_05530 [Candidatus Doudnabacteria bacterium]|nr:hypothetical protein [Candidatus Doudnabacteria bacterium]
MPKTNDFAAAPETLPELRVIIELFSNFKLGENTPHPIDPEIIERLQPKDWMSLLTYLESLSRAFTTRVPLALQKSENLLSLSDELIKDLYEVLMVFQKFPLIPYLLTYAYYKYGDFQICQLLPELTMFQIIAMNRIIEELKAEGNEIATATAEVQLMSEIEDPTDATQVMPFVYESYALPSTISALISNCLSRNLSPERLAANLNYILDFAIQNSNIDANLSFIGLVRNVIFQHYPYGVTYPELTVEVQRKIDTLLGYAEA